MTQPLKMVGVLAFLTLGLALAFCKTEGVEIRPREKETKPGINTIRREAFFNQRYCEVLVARIDVAGLSLDACNSFGCHTCPEEAWTALHPDRLKEELSLPFVRLNGPRHWLMDSVSSNSINAHFDYTFGENEMSLVASISLYLDMLALPV